MFECTKIALKETENDLKKVDYIRNLISQIIFLCHTIYQIVLNFIDKFLLWQLILYSIFTFLTFIYLIFTLILTDFKNFKIKSTPYQKFEKGFKILKRIVRIYSLIMAISATCNLANNVNAFNLIITALLIVSFVLQIVFEILIKIIQTRVNYIIDALKADIDLSFHPVNKILTFFGKKEETKENKNQKILKLKAEENKLEEKAEKKANKQKDKKEKKSKKQEKTSKINDFFKIKKSDKTSVEDLVLIEENNDT